jgi:antitoxin component of RelBE/YafQ-DinJ toxin-antitoxin module
MKDRLQLRIDSTLLAKSKVLAKKSGLTTTAMVESLLRAAVDLDEEDERIKKQKLDAEQI